MKTQSHLEQIYLCVERHPDRCIVAAFTSEEAAEAFCNDPDNFYYGTQKYEVWRQGLDDYRLSLNDNEEII